MRAKFLKYLALISVIAGIYVIGLKKRYYVKTSLYPYVHTLWNNHEAFIFIGNEKTGVKGTLPGLLYHDFMGIFDMADIDSKNDFTVVHIIDGKLENSTFRNVKVSGTPFPFAGHVYYFEAGEDGRRFWRWNGTTFEPMSNREGGAIMSSFQYFSDIIQKEGWREANIPNSPTNDSLELKFTSEQLKVFLQRQEPSHEVIKVSLQGRTNSSSSEILAEVVPKWETVGRTDYLRTFK